MKKKKKSTLEAKLLTELAHSVAAMSQPAFWHKIADSPIFKGMKTRFTTQKPFDAFLATIGHPIAIEAKVHKEHTAFPLSKITKHQVKGLQAMEAAGGSGFVAVNVRYGLGKNRQNFISWIPVHYVVDYTNKGVKSVKVEQLRQHRCSQWNPKTKTWDLSLFELERANQSGRFLT